MSNCNECVLNCSHAEYVPLPKRPNGYDIALLKLRHPLTFNDNVKVALPRYLPNPDIGTELMGAGWGKTSPDRQSGASPRLKWVNKNVSFACMFIYVHLLQAS